MPKKQSKDDDSNSGQLKNHCARHYPGQIQGELRSACVSAGDDFKGSEKGLAQTRCRLGYGEEPRLVMACLIGVVIMDDISNNKDDFKKKLQVCAEQYPQHTEIDAFLQESCLTGIHLSELTSGGDAVAFEACGRISPERSFIGPCAVGLSLGRETTTDTASQNALCEKYFDHRKFHLTYRACLNARSVPIDGDVRLDDIMQGCNNVVSDTGNDNERAACLVGSSIHRAAVKKDDVAKRFQKCGAKQVSYEDRDVLACLTAASLLEFGERNRADSGCKTIFKQPKSSARGDCVNSLSLF